MKKWLKMFIVSFIIYTIIKWITIILFDHIGWILDDNSVLAGYFKGIIVGTAITTLYLKE